MKGQMGEWIDGWTNEKDTSYLSFTSTYEGKNI